jgi:hypothetical protein
MKEIIECIGDIGRATANSTIFTMLDLTSGFWQIQLDKDSQKLTAFIILRKSQFHWITSLMGLLGCPASFQRLMEGVLHDIQNVLVYIDDLLVHTDTHEKHHEVLDQILARLHKNHLKINLEKCVFGNKEVSYLRFTLTLYGIKPGKNKLKAIKDAKPPTNVKTIRPFVGLCNFFRTQIKDFALIVSLLFWLTCKDCLSRLPGTKEAISSISAFYPFQSDHFDLQMKDEYLQMLQNFMTKNEWPAHLSKQDCIYFQNLADKVFQDKNKVVWVRLSDYNYPQTALYLLSRYRK